MILLRLLVPFFVVVTSVLLIYKIFHVAQKSKHSTHYFVKAKQKYGPEVKETYHIKIMNTVNSEIIACT